MKTVSSFKADLIRKLHGTSLSRIEGIMDVIGEAGRTVITKLDPQETTRKSVLENAFIDEVDIFPAPLLLKGDKVIDLVFNGVGGQYKKVTHKGYSRGEQSKSVSVQYKNGVKVLKIKQPNEASSKISISECESLSGWAASDSGTNLTLDTSTFITKSASLNFDINTSSTTAVLENSTLSPIDGSTLGDEQTLYLWMYIPTASKVSSIRIRVGSDGSNYIQRSVTQTYGGGFQDGWNLLGFKLSDGTQVGSIDFSSLTYFQLQITHDQTGGTDYRVDSILLAKIESGSIYYYSSALFRGTDGVIKETPTSDNDIILLEADAYNVMLYEAAHQISQELQGENGSFDESYFRSKLYGTQNDPGLYREYRMAYPSQSIKAKSTYYRPVTGNYRG